MGLRIWETDPEAAPKPRQNFSNDLVGRFRSGYQINGRPASLQAWRVTTGDPEVADVIAATLGGEPQEWEARGEDKIEVFTRAEKVKIILDGTNALRQEMILYSRSNQVVRRCDGVEQTGEDDKGEPCACPATYAERKAAATKGTGCQPSVTFYFSLADAPDLGKFRFNSGSWSLVKDLGRNQIEERLAEIDGPTWAWLALEVVEFESGGMKKVFTKPVVEIIGPVK